MNTDNLIEIVRNQSGPLNQPLVALLDRAKDLSAEAARLRRDNERLRKALGQAFVFISPRHDPLPISHAEMAERIRLVLEQTE